ncbi:hypothetical protein C8J57DRAFT_1235781 [Mycena rebaudengoi]|nr:hypothetical protein C8J57DRAFT_1235781 [Mycena rebaudengoi]
MTSTYTEPNREALPVHEFGPCEFTSFDGEHPRIVQLVADHLWVQYRGGSDLPVHPGFAASPQLVYLGRDERNGQERHFGSPEPTATVTDNDNERFLGSLRFGRLSSEPRPHDDKNTADANAVMISSEGNNTNGENDIVIAPAQCSASRLVPENAPLVLVPAHHYGYITHPPNAAIPFNTKCMRSMGLSDDGDVVFRFDASAPTSRYPMPAIRIDTQVAHMVWKPSELNTHGEPVDPEEAESLGYLSSNHSTIV